ncbi:hypothetical protein BP6252_04765 [Coleophoma cylindrospora]|uniref:Uncharacterized protein n=1 Tax=Coleophoma cylindrospora TaxID=1849047 RepID=A0A3D8S1E8_9HELO|nr:hypothetical protein BP6252_04765 [Coleophoma cylindrospora]
MPNPQPITEMVVFHLQDGVNLEQITPDSPSPAVQAFVKLTQTINSQPGSIHWESFEHCTAFTKSPERASFTAGLSQLFDLEVEAPVTLYVHVTDTQGALAAFRSGVTEVAFYTMPDRPDEALRAEIEDPSGTTLQNVQVIGKATGAAIAWVFDAVPHSLASGPDSISLAGFFGYDSIDVHMQWRETPEGIAAREGGDDSVRPATIVPGIDAETGYFHVKFREGE